MVSTLRVVVVVVAMLASMTVLAAAQDYCKICANHIMCKYKPGTDGSACGKKTYGAVAPAEQKEVVQIHNDLRRKIATGAEPKNPAAANMRQMSWDAELATMAQTWANQCIYSHDECRDVARFKVGQNTRYTSSSKADLIPEWTRTVQSWYNEVSIWDPSKVDPFATVSGAGHFTQVVWADTYLVGCGMSIYTPSPGKTTKLYICNYGPQGNFKGKPMYKKGTACSACPAGTTCKNSLCG